MAAHRVMRSLLLRKEAQQQQQHQPKPTLLHHLRHGSILRSNKHATCTPVHAEHAGKQEGTSAPSSKMKAGSTTKEQTQARCRRLKLLPSLLAAECGVLHTAVEP
jgi:hypothetical protein